MICNPCKNNRHELCPSRAAAEDEVGPPTGLSPEGDVIQRGGLCTCQHREPR